MHCTKFAHSRHDIIMSSHNFVNVQEEVTGIILQAKTSTVRNPDEDQFTLSSWFNYIW